MGAVRFYNPYEGMQSFLDSVLKVALANELERQREQEEFERKKGLIAEVMNQFQSALPAETNVEVYRQPVGLEFDTQLNPFSQTDEVEVPKVNAPSSLLVETPKTPGEYKQGLLGAMLPVIGAGAVAGLNLSPLVNSYAKAYEQKYNAEAEQEKLDRKRQAYLRWLEGQNIQGDKESLADLLASGEIKPSDLKRAKKYVKIDTGDKQIIYDPNSDTIVKEFTKNGKRRKYFKVDTGDKQIIYDPERDVVVRSFDKSKKQAPPKLTIKKITEPYTPEELASLPEEQRIAIMGGGLKKVFYTVMDEQGRVLYQTNNFNEAKEFVNNALGKSDLALGKSDLPPPPGEPINRKPPPPPKPERVRRLNARSVFDIFEE